MIGQCEQYDSLSYLMLTQLSWISYRRMLRQVPYVIRLCPYLYLMLPLNKGLTFEIPLVPLSKLLALSSFKRDTAVARE